MSTPSSPRILPGLTAISSPGPSSSDDELDALLERAAELKADPRASRALDGRAVALVFEKPSHPHARLVRGRASPSSAATRWSCAPSELQLSRGESPKRHRARARRRHVAAFGVRTHADDLLRGAAAEQALPIFNMLTADHHPARRWPTC